VWLFWTLISCLELFQAYGKMTCYTSIEGVPFSINWVKLCVGEKEIERERYIWIVVLRGTSVRPTLIEVYWTRSVKWKWSLRWRSVELLPTKDKGVNFLSIQIRPQVHISDRLSAFGLTRHGFVLCIKGVSVGLKGMGVVYKLSFASSTKQCGTIHYKK
jgi:hypothetical protein